MIEWRVEDRGAGAMFRTLLIIIAALGLAAWVFYCVKTHAPEIESALLLSAEDALAERSMEWATPRADGRDLTLEGDAPSNELRTRAGEVARGLPGVRVVDNRLGIAPPAPELPKAPESQDFLTRIIVTDDTLQLSGYAPSDEAKEALVEQARAQFAEKQVLDQLGVRAGAEEDWATVTSAMIESASSLSNGGLVLAGKRLDVLGQPINDSAVDNMQNTLGAALSDGLEINLDGVTPAVVAVATSPEVEAITPYTTVIRKSAEGLSLSGLAPSASAREAAIEQARELFGASSVQNHLAVAPGAVPPWSAAVEAGLSGLNELDGEGLIEIIDDELHVSGRGQSAQVHAQVTTTIDEALPSGLRANYAFESAPETTPQPVTDAPLQPEAPDVPAASDNDAALAKGCRQRFAGMLTNRKILFELASTSLTRDSQLLLDILASVAQSCPLNRIEIAGHTDAQGTEENNLNLSQTRAEAVRDYMVSRGVAIERVIAVGYGESQPIADNDTAEGAAKNRRIEFSILD